MSLMPFENLGYHIHYKVLNTKDFGIPQNRERIFIIGIRDDEDNNFNFPKEIPLELKLKDILQDNPNSKYYLSDEQYKKIQTRNRYGDHIIEKDDHIHPCLCAIGKSDVGVIDENNYIKVDEKYYLSDKAIAKCERSSANKNLSKKGLDEVSRTLIAGYYKIPFDGQYISSYCLDTGNAQAIEKNNKIRRLTPIECERLQGFPDNFTEGVSDTQRYKQMGNTITVNVIQTILKNLKIN